MKVVYIEKKKKFIPYNKFLVPILLTPLENNLGAATTQQLARQLAIYRA